MDTTHSRRGFTLLEILVATAVILLLIAILLSSLEQSQTRAKSTVCLANLRSIGTAMRLYQEDARGWLPVGPADKVWYVDRMIGLVREPAPGRRPYPWTNCHWGGKRAAWIHTIRNDPPVPETLGRPLTRYLYRGTGLDQPTPLFECPSDVGSPLLENPIGEKPIYYLCGNSYYTNPWESYQPLGTKRSPPSAVVLVEEGAMYMDLVSGRQNLGWHGRFSTHNALFLDFHAETRFMDTRSYHGPGWVVENYFDIMDYYRY
ncbi:MAG TPA: prepilin-type N-terminal cleavage/methylation domain-containing protein [Phycisphaerae bacterium]|nr:prepilin-type N-terminal cleavage/methylation domain-containing protein [Phycisphaerae bacterium]HRR87523.1 prepilin-type N-terminal cleavage/methylation domain-containing protein [Phycisphaerae bacterium]